MSTTTYVDEALLMSTTTYVDEALLMSTHKIHVCGEIR